MKTTLALLFCILCSSLMFGQYSSSVNLGVTDLSSYCTSTVNCWHQLGGILAPVDGAIGADGYGLWRKTDNSLLYWDTPTQTFKLATGVSDTFTKQIAVKSQTALYRLKSTDSYCGTGPTYRTQAYNGNAWVNLTTGNDCKLSLAVGADGTLMSIDIGNANGGPVYKFNGTGWTAFGTVNLLTISVADSGTMCGVSKVSGTAKVYLLGNSSTFAAMTAQPSGTPKGCAISQNGGSTYLYAWSTAGAVSAYDYSTGTWKAIVTPSVGGAYVQFLMTNGKAETFMTMGGGPGGGGVYHYNVYPAYAAVTVTGSWNGCPDDLHPCTQTAQHKVTAHMAFPHSIGSPFGATNVQTVSSTTNVNVNSYDTNVNCDLIFGDANDPECQAAASGTNVLCLVSGQSLLGGTPSVPKYLDSQDYVTWNGTRQVSGATAYQNAWRASYVCGVQGACKAGTAPACPAADIHGEVILPTPELATSVAATQCLLGPWTTVSVYPPGTQPIGCVRVAVDHPVTVPGYCY